MQARLVLSLLAGLAWVCALAIPGGQADEGRFVPWKESKAPPLALRDLAGAPHALADYRGKVVLVNFWATWCEPCREEMPSMQRLQDRLAGQPFAVLAVNYGEADTRASEFVKRSSLDLTVLLDLPPSEGLARASDVADRFGSEDAGFHQRVREGYRSLAVREPERWLEPRPQRGRCRRSTRCLCSRP